MVTVRNIDAVRFHLLRYHVLAFYTFVSFLAATSNGKDPVRIVRESQSLEKQ